MLILIRTRINLCRRDCSIPSAPSTATTPPRYRTEALCHCHRRLGCRVRRARRRHMFLHRFWRALCTRVFRHEFVYAWCVLLLRWSVVCWPLSAPGSGRGPESRHTQVRGPGGAGLQGRGFLLSAEAVVLAARLQPRLQSLGCEQMYYRALAYVIVLAAAQ